MKGLVKNVLPQQFRRYFMYNVEFNSRLADERTRKLGRMVKMCVVKDLTNLGGVGWVVGWVVDVGV